MKQIRILSIFLLAILLSFVFTGCKETSKYDIKEVKNAKNVVINKKELKVSFDVDNIVSEFNQTNIVITNAKALVYTDKDCSKEAEVPLKLEEGNNKFYFKVILDKDNKLLKKTIWELNINRLEKIEGTEYELYSFENRYNVGDTFKGGRIKKTINGNEKYIEITEDMVTGFTTTKEGKYQVTINYEGQTFSVEITVYEKYQLLIPDYSEIIPSELNVDDIYHDLAVMIAKIKYGNENLEELVQEVLDDSDLEHYCFILSRAFKEAGFTKTQLECLINHILQCFEGYDSNNSNFIDAIIDMLTRVISVFDNVDSIISEEQIGQIVFTLYKNYKQGYLRHQAIIDALKEDPKYEALIKTVQDTDQLLLCRNEVMYIGIVGYQELREISKVIKNDMDIVSRVIEVLNDYMENNTIEINEEFITNLNKVGEIIDGLFQKIGPNTLNTCLVILTTMLGKQFNDVKEYLEDLNTIEIIKNLDPMVKIIINYLKNIKLQNKEEIEETLNAIMHITNFDNITLDFETKKELGQSLVVVSKILTSKINELSPTEKFQLNTLLNIFCEKDGNNISSTKVFSLISKLANVDLNKATTEELVSYVDELQSIMKPAQKLGYSLNSQIIVKQNTTKEEFVNLFKDEIKLYKYTLNENNEYETENVELSVNLLTIFDTTRVGAKLFEVTIDNMTLDIAYFVEGLEHEYVMSPNSIVVFTDLLVYDLNNNVYPNKWFELSGYPVIIVDKLTGYACSVKIDSTKVKIENPDTSTIGKKQGILTIDLDEYGVYYLPIEYYVINLENPVITKYNVELDDKIYVGKNSVVSGNVMAEYNYKIKVEALEETKKLVWQYDNPQFISFDETNVTGLDKNKEGTQKVTINVNGQSFEAEIYVHPLSDMKKIKSVSFSMMYNYVENKDYKEQANITIVCEAKEYSFYDVIYQEALKVIKAYKLPFEITLEPIEEVKLGTTTFKLTVHDTINDEVFTFENTVNIIDKDEFLPLKSLQITLGESILLITTETDDDILKLIKEVSFYGKYYSGTLFNDDAYKWAQKNIEVIRNVSQGTITFRAHGAEQRFWHNIYFGLSANEATINFVKNDNTLPEFVTNFSDEDLFNGIVRNITFSNNIVIDSSSMNLYQKYKSYIDIVREEEKIKLYIDGEKIKEFTIIKSANYTVKFDYSFIDNASLNINDLNGTIISQLSEVNFQAETSTSVINLYIRDKALTESILNYITFGHLPTQAGEYELQINFNGASASKLVTWYLDEIIE